MKIEYLVHQLTEKT